MSDRLDNWLRQTETLVGPLTVKVAGYDVEVELTPPALERVFLPVLDLLHDRGPGRVIAGLAGIPGGGKSTFAAVLQKIADLVLPGQLATVGIDGWHYPNAVLDVRTTRDPQGNIIPLRQRKGGPESYDIDAMLSDLRRLREARTAVSLPAYDRTLHEPVADALTVAPDVRMVLFEGNYVLGGVAGVPAWDQVAAVLAPRMYLAADRAAAEQQTVARHIRGGLAPEQARDRYDRNDRLNTDLIEATAGRADVTISLEPPTLR